MKLKNQDLYTFLQEIGVKSLYHANTVTTSTSFIKAGGLLSRGAVEALNLDQTPQKSDPQDKKYDVWNDVFFDTTDLHKFFGRQNYYGPVLFEYSVDLIKNEEYEFWVTKMNPTYWTDEMKISNKYFENVAELRAMWGDLPLQNKMITIKNPKSAIPFKYLKKVVVDNPSVRYLETVYFNEAVKVFKELMKTHSDLTDKFIQRQCGTCFCRSNYLNQKTVIELEKLFISKNH